MKQTLLFSLCIWLVTESLSPAAAVPVGTTMVVLTNAAISTHATPGNHFTGRLEQGVGGLPAGTHVTGLIQTSRGSRSTTSSSPLTLVLTSVSAHGKTVRIKTSPVQPQGAKTARGRRGGSFSFGEDVFPAGTRLEFRLSQPANL